MASRVLDRLVAQMGLDNSRLAADVAQSKAIIGRGFGTLRKEAELTEKALHRVNRGFQGGQNINFGRLLSAGRAYENVAQRASLLRGSLFAATAAVGGFTAALGSNVLARYADSFAQINNQMRPLVDNSAELEKRFNAVADVADASRSGLRETATLYARIQKALPQLDVGKTLEVTTTIQKALQLGGATTQEAASAAIQFSQALASNRLGGEELRTILETPLGGALAKGLGVGLGELRKMSEEGKLTASVLIDALGKIGPEVAEQFNKSTKTLDQAIVQADNKLTEYIGRTNDAYGATKILGEAIVGLANNLEFLGNIAGPAALAMGAVFAGRLAGSSAKDGVGARIATSVKGIAGLASGRVAAEALDLSKKELIAANENLDEHLKKLRELRSLDDVAKRQQFAPSEQSKVERGIGQVAGLDDKRAKAAERLTKARLDLADVSSRSTPRIIAQTNALAKAEQRVTELLVAQERARKFIKFNPNAEVAQKNLAAAQAALLPAQDKVSNIQSALAKTTAARDAVLLKERTDALKKVRDIELEISGIESKKKSAIASTRGAAFERDAVAAKNYAAALADVDKAAQAGLKSTADSLTMLGKIEKASTIAGRSVSVMKSAFSGFVSFLGGPFGFAIFSLVAAIEVYSAAAAKSAAATARVNKMLDEMGVKSLLAVEGAKKLGSAFEVNDAKTKLDEYNKELEGLIGGFGSLDRFIADLFKSDTLSDIQLEANFLKRSTAGARVNPRQRVAPATPDSKAAAQIEAFAIRLAKAPEDAEEVLEQLKKIAQTNISAEMAEFVKRTSEAVDQAYRLKAGQKALQEQVRSGTPAGGFPGFDDSLRELRAQQATNQIKADEVIKNSLAIASQTEQEKALEAEIKRLREELASKGLENALSDDQIRGAAQNNINAANAKSTIDLLKQFEGFLTNARRDNGGAFRVGYGSDTKTSLDGKVSTVTPFTTVTQAEAERDLSRRVAAFQNVIREQIGSATFDAMSENAKAALTSVAYNYGSLPLNVASAAKSGDALKTANAIRARKGDNNGINDRRRDIEADVLLSGNTLALTADNERKNYEDLIRSSRERVKALEAESAAIGKSVYERTLAAEKMRLEQEATKDGAKLTAEQSKEIAAQADATAKAEAAKASAEFKSEALTDNKAKIEALRQEAAAFGQNAFEAAKAARAQELLAKARENGPVSAEQTAEINALAEAYAREAEAKAIAQFNDDNSEKMKQKLEDLGLEAEQVGKLASEQERLAYILERKRALEAAGIPITAERLAQINAEAAAWSALTQKVSDQKLAQEQANEVRDEFKSDLKGFITDIAHGENAMDALTNAVKRFADKLLDMSLDGLLDGLFGGGASGGGGGGGGLLGSLFSNIFAGFFADGGNIPAGKVGLVGERGPEFISGPATITPMPRLAAPARAMTQTSEIHVVLHPTPELWAEVDARDQQAIGTSVQVSISESSRMMKRNFKGTSADVKRRQI